MRPYLGHLKVVHYFPGWIGGVGVKLGGWFGIIRFKVSQLVWTCQLEQSLFGHAKKSMVIWKFDVGKSKTGQILAMWIMHRNYISPPPPAQLGLTPLKETSFLPINCSFSVRTTLFYMTRKGPFPSKLPSSVIPSEFFFGFNMSMFHVSS